MFVIMDRQTHKVYEQGAKMMLTNAPEPQPADASRADSPTGPAPAAVEAPPLLPRTGEVKCSLLKVAGERHATLLALLKRSLDDRMDVDYVHDLRVATRRLAEALALLESLMDKPTSHMIEASLKGLRKAAGELRDLDVGCQHLTSGGKWRMPAVLRHVAAELVAGMQSRRAALAKSLAHHASSASVTGAMVLLVGIIEEQSAPDKVAPAEALLHKALEKRMAKREKQLRKAFGQAAQKQTPEALHQARIAAKKLRYVVELADAAGLKRQKKELKFLKGVQELLGVHHDVHVILETLGKTVHAKGRTIPALPAAWRKWHRTKEREQAKRAADFFMRSYGWMSQNL